MFEKNHQKWAKSLEIRLFASVRWSGSSPVIRTLKTLILSAKSVRSGQVRTSFLYPLKSWVFHNGFRIKGIICHIQGLIKFFLCITLHVQQYLYVLNVNFRFLFRHGIISFREVECLREISVTEYNRHL